MTMLLPRLLPLLDASTPGCCCCPLASGSLAPQGSVLASLNTSNNSSHLVHAYYELSSTPLLLLLLLFLVIVGIEPTALGMLGKCCTTQATPLALLFSFCL